MCTALGMYENEEIFLDVMVREELAYSKSNLIEGDELLGVLQFYALCLAMRDLVKVGHNLWIAN